jgi:hypothetical protein
VRLAAIESRLERIEASVQKPARATRSTKAGADKPTASADRTEQPAAESSRAEPEQRPY